MTERRASAAAPDPLTIRVGRLERRTQRGFKELSGRLEHIEGRMEKQDINGSAEKLRELAHSSESLLEVARAVGFVTSKTKVVAATIATEALWVIVQGLLGALWNHAGTLVSGR